jgi:hypothetical protein
MFDPVVSLRFVGVWCGQCQVTQRAASAGDDCNESYHTAAAARYFNISRAIVRCFPAQAILGFCSFVDLFPSAFFGFADKYHGYHEYHDHDNARTQAAGYTLIKQPELKKVIRFGEKRADNKRKGKRHASLIIAWLAALPLCAR